MADEKKRSDYKNITPAYTKRFKYATMYTKEGDEIVRGNDYTTHFFTPEKKIYSPWNFFIGGRANHICFLKDGMLDENNEDYEFWVNDRDEIPWGGQLRHIREILTVKTLVDHGKDMYLSGGGTRVAELTIARIDEIESEYSQWQKGTEKPEWWTRSRFVQVRMIYPRHSFLLQDGDNSFQDFDWETRLDEHDHVI
jgi:hypothetical protein